jgi:hypothetical protein
MRRKRALWGGRAVSIIVAGFVGYVFGGWNLPVLRTTGLSAAQMVALRFPQDLADTASVAAASVPSVTPATYAPGTTIAAAQAALLNPAPMVPQTLSAQPTIKQASVAPIAVPQTTAADNSAPPASAQVAAVEPAAPSRAAVPAPQPPAPAAARTYEAKQIVAAIHRHVDERPGFILNDAQIASIKARLHLTPDQEDMWPAVEAALRNLAYTRAREARRHGTNADAQLASADPNGVEVQGLKSAAIPLLMSFNSEQKDEVRNLAHVMGLDQLASQF